MPDEHGYPTEEELRIIREWDANRGFLGLLEHVEEIWWTPEWGISKEGSEWNVSTGGWSGNEEIVAALQDNMMFWMMCWVQSRRGGHYIFLLPPLAAAQQEQEDE